MDFGNTTTSIWSKIKSYIDSKTSGAVVGGGYGKNKKRTKSGYYII